MVIVVLIVTVILDSTVGDGVFGQGLEDFVAWVKDNGVAGVFAMIGVYAVATVCFLPGSLLTLGAGFAFGQAFGTGLGILLGTISVVIGATVGACVAFLLARYAVRDAATRWAARYNVLRAIDQALKSKGLKIVGLLRLSPLIPFTYFNYAVAITSVKFRDYALATAAGIIPGTTAFVYIGTTISDLKDMSSSGTEESDEAVAVRWTLISVGLLATLGALVYVSVRAKRELSGILAGVASDSDSEGTPHARNSEKGVEGSQASVVVAA